MEKKPVSIVIPTYNRCKELKTTLDSLKKQSFKDFEVVIADDGSTDKTAELAETKYPFRILYAHQENKGRAAARNLGISRSGGDIIIFIDDHIIVEDNFVEEHFTAHQKYKKHGVGVVRGRVNFIQKPEDADKPMKKMRNISNENSPFQTFITNNISVARQALDLTGGFDPDFKEYGFQDQELGYRIRLRGIKFKVNPKAVGHIFSIGSIDTEKRLDKHRQAGRSAALFYRKHFWGGIQIGVNPFNLLMFRIYSLNNNYLKAVYRQKMEKYERSNTKRDKKKFDHWFFKLRFVYFLHGISEGLELYKKGEYQPLSAKNVVMLVSHQADLSGAPISLVILANNLKKYGFFPILVLPAKGPIEKRIDPDILVLNLNRYFKYFKLWNYVYCYRPALIHANTFLTEYALDIARSFGIKSIIHIREDLTIYPRIAQRITKKADRIIVISNSMIKDYPDPTKLDVVYNAIARVPAEVELLNNNLEESFNLLYIGTIEQRKGLKDLLQAVKTIYDSHNKRVTLTVLGKPLSSEIKYYEEVKEYIEDNGLIDIVEFAGVVDDTSSYLDKASIVVMPSYAEPFGRVIIEAMSRKKLVIGSQVGGIAEVITQYDNGFLVKPGQPEELAKMILYVWAKPEELKNKIKQRAYETVVKNYAPERYLEGVVSTYEYVLNNKVKERII